MGRTDNPRRVEDGNEPGVAVMRVTIATYGNPVEANLARGLLEAHGFDCFLADLTTMSMEGEASAAMQGGIRLQVPEADAADAVALLNEPMPQADEDSQGATSAEGVTRCPKCSSSNVRPGRPSPLLAVMTFLLLGLPLIFRRGAMECDVCHHRWREMR